MSKASTLYFRITLTIAIVCFAVAASHADIIPWLTTFEVNGHDNGGLGDNFVFFLTPGLPGPPFIDMTFSTPANLPSQTTVSVSPPTPPAEHNSRTQHRHCCGFPRERGHRNTPRNASTRSHVDVT